MVTSGPLAFFYINISSFKLEQPPIKNKKICTWLVIINTNAVGGFYLFDHYHVLYVMFVIFPSLF
jgi:hypothetical protein